MADVSLKSTVKSFIPRGSDLERGGKKGGLEVNPK